MIDAYPRRLVIYGHMIFPDLNMPPPLKSGFFLPEIWYKKPHLSGSIEFVLFFHRAGILRRGRQC